MTLSEYLNPALAVVAVVALGAGYYWFDLRSPPEEKETPSQALVIVTKSTNACFSADLALVTDDLKSAGGEVAVGVEQEVPITDLFSMGDTVTENQELARLSAPPQQPGAPARPNQGPISLRAPAAGLVTEVKTIVGAPASPQAGPMFPALPSAFEVVEFDAQRAQQSTC